MNPRKQVDNLIARRLDRAEATPDEHDDDDGTALYVITTLSVSTAPGVEPTPSRFYRTSRAEAIALADRWGSYAYVQEYRGGQVIHERSNRSTP
jgi:hypothetical protein